MQKILSAMRKAVSEFNMIDDGDKIVVGVSGGKDSLLLLKALKHYQRFADEKFELLAVYVNMNFDDLDMEKYNAFKTYIEEDLQIKFHNEDTQLAQILFDGKHKSPCSLCSKIRRGALNTVANQYGYNKVALGHHSDDVLETFLLSFMYESRLSTFQPKSYLDRTDITIIRPFVYLNESHIVGASRDLPILPNPCPEDKHTQREYMKDLVKNLLKDIPQCKQRMFSAITHPERANLWKKEN